MTWAKIEDNLYLNPKVRDVSIPARWTYVASILYAAGNRTSGRIPFSALQVLDGSNRISVELVGANLWEPADGGWMVHDFLKYNRSKERIDEISEARSKAGSKGAAIRHQSAGQIAKQVDLSGSGSSTPTSSLPSGAELWKQQEPEGQTASNLPDDAYRQIDNAWIQAAGTTLNRVAGERFEAYALRLTLPWVLDAITETGLAGVKDPRYTFKILDNWERDGRLVNTKPEPGSLEERKAKYGGSRNHELETWLRGHIREHKCGRGCAEEAYEEAHGRVPA